MSDPVLMSKDDLGKMAKDLSRSIEINDRLKRDLHVVTEDRDRALTSANNAKMDLERIRKVMPADKVQEELKALRVSMGEAHKQINVLEKDLAASKAESEVRGRLVMQVNRKFDGIQATFDTLQIARDKAQVERDQALAELERHATAYKKLQAEFDAFQKVNPPKKTAAEPRAALAK